MKKYKEISLFKDEKLESGLEESLQYTEKNKNPIIGHQLIKLNTLKIRIMIIFFFIAAISHFLCYHSLSFGIKKV